MGWPFAVAFGNSSRIHKAQLSHGGHVQSLPETQKVPHFLMMGEDPVGSVFGFDPHSSGYIRSSRTKVSVSPKRPKRSVLCFLNDELH